MVKFPRHYDFRIRFIGKYCIGGSPKITRSKLHLLLAQRLKAFCDPCEQELATELALHFEGGRDYEQAVNIYCLRRTMRLGDSPTVIARDTAARARLSAEASSYSSSRN